MLRDTQQRVDAFWAEIYGRYNDWRVNGDYYSFKIENTAVYRRSQLFVLLSTITFSVDIVIDHSLMSYLPLIITPCLGLFQIYQHTLSRIISKTHRIYNLINYISHRHTSSRTISHQHAFRPSTLSNISVTNTDYLRLCQIYQSPTQTISEVVVSSRVSLFTVLRAVNTLVFLQNFCH